MSPLLFPLVLLSLRAALADPVPLTFEDTDPVTGERLECDRCPPGTYLRARCTATRKSDCARCPSGSFTELWNYIGKCLRCGVCGHDQVVKTECTAERDCQCECKQGFYYMAQYDMCLQHSECPSGQGALTAGTADHDTVCHVCPNGTYSDITSAHLNCTEHKHCHAAAGLHLLLRGSTWHDSVCTSCEENMKRDGAVYLKEIIPAFFNHHKVSLRRLRRVVHRLPSEDGKREGRTSGLNLSELHERINTWVTSATAEQIRQLPEILAKTGADNTSERLKKKLQRIESRLQDVCAFGNEVDVDFVLG